MIEMDHLILVSSCLLGLAVFLLAYRLCWHPLADVPGPKWAALSNTWHAYYVRNGRMLQLAKSLHNIYGPAVRVGPGEVWFDSKEAFAIIYNATQGFEKSDFYLATVLHKPKLDRSLEVISPDLLDLLSERDMDRYRLQRRLIGPTYQMTNLSRHEQAIDEVLERVISRLHGLKGITVDLKEWMHIITLECLSSICLSWSPGYLKAGSDGGSGSHAYIGWRRKSVFGLFPWVTLASSYSRTMARLFAKLWGVTYKMPDNFKPFFPMVYAKASRRLNAALQPKPHKNSISDDLLQDLVQLHRERPEFSLPYLRRMIMTNFGAGHETTTSTLTSVIAMIGSHSQVQDKVTAEVRGEGHPGDTYSITSYSETLHLAYTQAAIKEAQRLYPVLGMSPSRKVPEKGFSIHGFYFPPGTTVGCNPNSLHRNPSIFGPDAENFRPERWLDGKGNVKEMERFNLIWGGGARTCPGRNLAQLIVYKTVVTLMREFVVVITKMPDDDEIRYYFMAMLTGIEVRFIPRSSGKVVTP